jgi:hypothetical protein
MIAIVIPMANYLVAVIAGNRISVPLNMLVANLYAITTKIDSTMFSTTVRHWSSH